MKKILIAVIDGCAPEYMTKETAPRIFRLAGEKGFVKTVRCALPSVTNVNHACLLSGKWPEDTGVSGNYFYEPETGREGYIEERGYMKAKTILQRCQELGGTTALLAVKGKVVGVYGDGADIGISAESPDETLLKRCCIETPPDINSVDSTRWVMKAAYDCIRSDDPDIVYCTTTDSIFHHFGPDSAEAKEQITAVDEYIERISSLDSERQIYITADHGMNQKTTIIGFQSIAEKAGFDVYCLPPLKDRYIENHIYQEGGMLYIFLKDKGQGEAFCKFAKNHPLVEQVLPSSEAAKKYHLPQEQIGDYVLFAGKDKAFGEIDGEVLYTQNSRSHGSLHETEVPLLTLNPMKAADNYKYHKDIAAYLFEYYQNVLSE